MAAATPIWRCAGSRRVAIIPTGTELVSLNDPDSQARLQPGDIVEFNSIVLEAPGRSWGCVVSRFAPAPDDFQEMIQALRWCRRWPSMIWWWSTPAARPAPRTTRRVVDSLGQVVVHGIAIRPGHPVILGVAQGKAIAGIPGYPVSAAMAFDLLVKPVIYRWQGLVPPRPPTVQATLTQKIHSSMGEDEFPARHRRAGGRQAGDDTLGASGRHHVAAGEAAVLHVDDQQGDLASSSLRVKGGCIIP